MKCWFFYIRIPVEKIHTFPIMKLLNTNYYNGICESLELKTDENGEYICGMYAWTDSEDVMKKFKLLRNPKYFIWKEMDIEEDSEDWISLNTRFNKLKILPVGFTDEKKRTYNIPRTFYEDDIISDESTVTTEICNDYINSRPKIEDFVCIIDIFEDELGKALDLLGWSDLVVEYGFVDDEIAIHCNPDCSRDDIVDMYQRNSAYNIGFSGGRMEKRNLDPVLSYIYMLGGLLV